MLKYLYNLILVNFLIIIIIIITIVVFQVYFTLNTTILGTFLHFERPYWTGNGTAPQSKSFLEDKISESEQISSTHNYYYFVVVYTTKFFFFIMFV